MAATPCNALNIKQQGVTYFDGTASFSGITGTIGSVLTSTGPSTPPTFQANAATLPSGALQYFATSGGSSFTGWLKCDGSVISQATYPALYSQIGLIGGPNTVWNEVNGLKPYQLVPSLPGGGNSLAYGNGLYVLATSTAQAIATSTNAVTWSTKPLPTGITASSVTYGSLYLMAPTSGLNVYTSTDTITWTARASNSTSSINSVSYANSIYFYTSQDGITGSSTDAITWVANPRMSGQVVNSIAFGNSVYVAVGGNSGGVFIATSTNGSIWSSKTPTISGVGTGGGPGLIYAGGKYVGYGGSTNPILQTSTDGINYRFVNNISTTSTVSSLTYGLSTYVLTGAGGMIATSTDTITWSSQTSGTVSNINSSIFGTVFIAAGAGGNLRSSTDSITWTSRTSGTTSAINALTYGSVYVFGGAGGVLASSTDGITWTSRTSGTTSVILSLTYGNGMYVYTCVNSTLASSTDAITWTARSVPTTGLNIIASVFGANVYVCVGSSGIILTSTDSITWSLTGQYSNFSLNSITYDGSKFVVLPTSSRYGVTSITSPDGITWTANQAYGAITAEQLNSVAFGNSVFVAIGNGTTSLQDTALYSSTDGGTWTKRSIANFAGQSLTSLTFANGLFCVVGANALIATSTDGINWKQQQSSFGLTYGTVAQTTTFVSVTYGSTFVVAATQGNIITSNTAFAYDTSSNFKLPTDAVVGITNDYIGQFPRSLYIKT